MLSVSLSCQKISSWHDVSVVNEPKHSVLLVYILYLLLLLCL
ncbi:uncharacterized protein DC041_0004921 [Schistosoma bovis]|uniref:Uncharacterized protein n=1 Tax=Schistosoma bovis TaxID=6184 RepID=A0A430Q0J7_SCHBO|nr:uncharacterized protein DC041_0004921 [Schistosoma bovis]